MKLQKVWPVISQSVDGVDIITSTGTPTCMIWNRFHKGESLGELMDAYGCTAVEIEAAIRWETLIAHRKERRRG